MASTTLSKRRYTPSLSGKKVPKITIAKCAAVILPIVFAPTALNAETWLPAFAMTAEPAPINSVTFALRGAVPGQFGYLQTIKYIDDGMRFADPEADFSSHPLARCASIFGGITQRSITTHIIEIGACTRGP